MPYGRELMRQEVFRVYRGFVMNRRRRLIRIAVVLAVCISIVLTVVLVGGGDSQDAVPETAVIARGALVLTAPVRGNLEMTDRAHLSFGVTGTVSEILVARGDSVEEGQVLALLDAPSLELNVEMAEVQVETARAQLRAARAQYEKALDGWEVPEGWEFLEEMLEFLAGSLGREEATARANLDMAELNLELAKLSLEAADLNLKMAVIEAPFDGVVADITIAEGQQISAATMAAPAVSLLGADRMEMRGFIDELDISTVEAGQNVTITLDALPDEELHGKVAFVSPMGTVMFGVVSYETVITIEDSHEGVRDGMSASADIIIERREDVLLVSNRAIRGTREAPLVHVYVDGQVEEREVTLGLSDGINTEVLSGLEEGEEAVLPGRGTPSGGFFRS